MEFLNVAVTWFFNDGNNKSSTTDFWTNAILFLINFVLVNAGTSSIDTGKDLLRKGLIFIALSSLKVLIESKLILEGSSINKI